MNNFNTLQHQNVKRLFECINLKKYEFDLIKYIKKITFMTHKSENVECMPSCSDAIEIME